MDEHEKINYLELAASDLEKTKAFFSEVFHWQFTDFGPQYTAFNFQGLEGGFYQANLCNTSENGGALIVFYSDDLTQTMEKIKRANGSISKDIFSFPGGKRFHFKEPSGNEFAVWTKTQTTD